MRLRLLLTALVACVLCGTLAAPAAAHGLAFTPPVGLLGVHFPSVKSIVHDVVKFFFGTLLDALVPPFLRDAALGSLKWLIAVPNPADRRLWPTVGELATDLKYVGIGLLPLTFTLSALRYWIGGLAGGNEHAGTAVIRTAGACAGVVAYSWAFLQTVAAVNVVTNAILSFPVVERGLRRTVGLLFGGALLSGDEVWLAVLGIAAVILATGLFMIKVALMVLFALWYVTGAFLIALSPLPEVQPFWRVWKFGLTALAAIPIGWCILFALCGAFALDMTGAGLGTGGLGSKLVGAFATIITFYLALRWPFIVLGRLKSYLGPGLALGRASGGGDSAPGRSASSSSGAAAVGVARAKLARGALAGGRAITGALPAGGLVGLGARVARTATPAVRALATRVPGMPRAAAAAAPAATALARGAAAIRQRGGEARKAATGAMAGGGKAPAVVGAAATAALRPQASPAPDAQAAPPTGRGPVADRTDGGAATRRRPAETHAPSKSFLPPRAPEPATARATTDPAPTSPGRPTAGAVPDGRAAADTARSVDHHPGRPLEALARPEVPSRAGVAADHSTQGRHGHDRSAAPSPAPAAQPRKPAADAAQRAESAPTPVPRSPAGDARAPARSGRAPEVVPRPARPQRVER